MAAEASVDASPERVQTRVVAKALVCITLGVCAVVVVLQAHAERVEGLSFVLGAASIVAGAAVFPTARRASLSASFIVAMLAAAFLGPVSAAASVLIAELIASRRTQSSRWETVLNLLAAVPPALLAGNLVRAFAPERQDEAVFYVIVAAAGAVYLTVNFSLAALGERLLRRRSMTWRVFWEYTPTQALNIGLAVAGAAIYVKVGLPGIVFALLALFTFAYQAHLLEQSRHRAEQYVSLSWGVLDGVMRAMDTRDRRAARHAAAVARFARDMASAVGLSEGEKELAHTAGLLHDIGHFALSDRVHEAGRTLNDDDWEAIHRHPGLGADMLKDLGIYGPVAEIVLAHHERPDGFGYPYGLTGEQIPAIARIIAVAETYDTITANDTYRTPKSSFEALNELRRVAGSQLDAEYVEVLAGLLSGEDLGYRHADAADFDTELDMERRIKEARAS